MIGAAAGLALRGRKPIVHALAAFLTMRAFEFIRTDIGIAGLPVKLSSFVPGFLSDGNGPTHQAIEDVALMRGIPGMQVFCPAGNEDMVAMLPKIWASDAPAYVRVSTRPTGYMHDSNFEIGKAEVVSAGTDVTILVYGMMFEQAMITKQILEKKGLSVGLANMRTLKPVDADYLVKVAAQGGLLVTIEDHFLTGGLYSILAETFLEREITAPVLPIALKEKWYKPGLLSSVLEYEGFTGPQMAGRILHRLGLQTGPLESSKIAENEFDE
jgi:transketolase